MLLPREKKILELLYKKKEEYTTNELARILHISPRTVKSDIARLRKELENDTGCIVKTKAGYGIWLSYSDKGKQYIEQILADYDFNHLVTIENRKYFIALKLLEEDKYVSMESIGESMFISKSTMVNSMNELAPILQQHGLQLEKKVKYGIKIVGTEKQKRIMNGYAIRKIIDNSPNRLDSKLQVFFPDIDLKKVEEILIDAQKKYAFVLADTSYSVIIIQLSICIQRIKQEKRCSIVENELNRDCHECEIIRYIAKKLQEKFQIELLEGDMAYLEMNFLGAKKILTENKLWKDDIALDKQSVEKWENIIAKTDQRYLENLREDDTFKYGLFIHLKAMFNRLNNNVHLDNPMKQMVKEELVYEVEVASYMANLISNDYAVTLGVDEVCDIAMYLAASMERQKARKQEFKKNVIVVCGSGTGTSQFLEARLTRMFPNLIVKKILPISQVESEINPDTDLIISTVPLVIEEGTVIHVSPLLNEKDVEMIEQALQVGKSANYETKRKYPNLYRLLSEKISIFNCDCKSRSEVISLLGNRLVFEKYVDESYIESAFKREQLSSTSIGDNFAVPHAFEGHVKKLGIGMMTLKKPIQWADDKVQIVFMLSLNANSQDIFREVFSELTDITKNKEMIEQILLADKFSDIEFI